MTQRVSDATGSFLARRTSRRGFLVRAAAVGSAVAVGPVRALVSPLPAWACAGRDRCRSGFTEFCCAVVGFNGCPHGSFVGGWWKAHAPTSSRICGGRTRYYVDCNVWRQSSCPSGKATCHNGSCNCFGVCRNFFTYNNCNVRYQNGRKSWVLCRVVLCQNPCNAPCGSSRTQPGCHCKCGGTHPDDRTSQHTSCTGCA